MSRSHKSQRRFPGRNRPRRIGGNRKHARGRQWNVEHGFLSHPGDCGLKMMEIEFEIIVNLM